MDLDWFFRDSQAAMGICSSFEAIRFAIMSCGASKTSKPDSVSDKRIEATSRHRQILNRLGRIKNHNHIDVLYSAFQSRSWSKEADAAYGRAIGAAAYSKSAQTYYAEDAGRETDGFWAWLEGVALRNEVDRIQIIRLETTDLFNAAIRAYIRA